MRERRALKISFWKSAIRNFFRLLPDLSPPSATILAVLLVLRLTAACKGVLLDNQWGLYIHKCLWSDYTPHPPFIFHSSQKFKQRAGDFQFCSFCERPEAGEPRRRRLGRPWLRVWIAGQTFDWSHSLRGCGGGSFCFEIALDFYRLALKELAALPRVNLWGFRGILGLLRLFFFFPH